MKLKLSYLFSFLLVAGVSSTAFGQEGSQGSDELPPVLETSNRDDKPLIYEPEGKPVNHYPSTSNSSGITIKPKPKTEATKSAPAKPEEDALSFNFLLHIIQRFKSMDIVEQ
ncbi:MAG: hypothetical protein KF775_06685 [Cyclobacteriaceae bacterium]|nr:hypothetical protein [Cyclobacteriaceae bacterium]